VPVFLNSTNPTPMDIVVATSGDNVTVELDVQNNAEVRIGDQYTVMWDDGVITVMRVIEFKSAQDYTNTIARRADTMREGVADVPMTLTARKAYQVKLAILRVEGEVLPNGTRIIGTTRLPNVMVPVRRITDDVLERFAVDTSGNLVLGALRSGARRLGRVARIRQNYAGERLIILGMPGKGKSQLVRSLLSQAMADNAVITGDDEGDIEESSSEGEES
jgi:hypothetical protein